MLTGSGPSQSSRTEAQQVPTVRLSQGFFPSLRAPLVTPNPNTSHPASSVPSEYLITLYAFAPGDGDVDVTYSLVRLFFLCDTCLSQPK